jgi:hypothetical protein
MSVERVGERRAFVLQSTSGEGCQSVRVALTGEEGAEHGPSRDTEYVRGDVTQLDVGGLQNFLDAIGLRTVAVDQLTTRPGEFP